MSPSNDLITPPSTPPPCSRYPYRYSSRSRQCSSQSSNSDTLSPPLIPLAGAFTEEQKDVEHRLTSDEYDHHRNLPSYEYALAHKEFALRPSLPIANNARPFMLHTPPSSPQKVFGITQLTLPQRKRKASQLATPSPEAPKKPKKEESENVKKLKTSPALKHLSIFTHAAFAEEEDSSRSAKALNEAFESASVEDDIEMEGCGDYSPSSSSSAGLRQSRPRSAKKIDLDVLLSHLPMESPYPPTPRSMAMPPLTFSSTIPSSSTFSSCSSMSPSSTFSSSFSSSSSSFGGYLDDEEEYQIKEDLSTRLGLGSIGLGIGDISIFPSSASAGDSSVPRAMSSRDHDKGIQSRARMTAVVHTAQSMAWS